MKKSKLPHVTKKGNKTPIKPTTTKTTKPKQNFTQATAPVAIGNTFRKQPAKQTKISDNQVRIEHVELFRAMTLSPVSNDPYFESVLSQTIQPGNGAFSEWLSDIAQRYEQYSINHIHFVMKTSMPTSTGGNVLMMTDIDAADPTTFTESTFMSTQNSVEGPLWQNLTHRIPSSACHKWLYVNDGTIPFGTDIKTYNAGTFQIGVNYPQSFGVVPKIIFRIFIDYSIDFRTPQLKNNNIVMKTLTSSSYLFQAPIGPNAVGPSFDPAPNISSGVAGSLANGGFTDPTQQYDENKHGFLCPKGSGTYSCIWRSRWQQTLYFNDDVVNFNASAPLAYLNAYGQVFFQNLDFIFGDGTASSFETFFLNLPAFRLIVSSANPYDLAILEVDFTFGFLCMITTLVFLPTLHKQGLSDVGIFPLYDQVGGFSLNRIAGAQDNLTMSKLFTHKKTKGVISKLVHIQKAPTMVVTSLDKATILTRLEKIVIQGSEITTEISKTERSLKDLNLNLRAVTNTSSQTPQTNTTTTTVTASAQLRIVPVCDASGAILRYIESL